jgi:NAD(P)-dependent dehydrogenase (short-subunit alcohol dehydrogenase family)
VTGELPPARLPLVDNISQTFDKLPPINLFRAAANAKTLYPAFIQYMYLLFKPLELDGRIERLIVLYVAFPLNAPYSATKGGIRMLMRTIAVELAPHQITVNNIGPGAIYTPIDKDVESDAKLNDRILAEIPMGRWGKPEEVAQLAVYLASEDAAYVTGSTHFIDGGMLRNAGSL